jgi:hypothetical protein
MYASSCLHFYRGIRALQILFFATGLRSDERNLTHTAPERFDSEPIWPWTWTPSSRQALLEREDGGEEVAMFFHAAQRFVA